MAYESKGKKKKAPPKSKPTGKKKTMDQPRVAGARMGRSVRKTGQGSKY